MKIYIVTHGQYEDNHISLCTTDFELAIKHFLDYSKITWYNSMANIDIWEDNKELYSYGSKNYHIVNTRKSENITYNDIKNDILKEFKLY